MFSFDQISKIPGWLTPSEAAALYESAKKLSHLGNIVEIGSWEGRSTICLAQGIKDAGVKDRQVVAIDPHTGSPEHHQRFGKVDTFASFKENLRLQKLESFVTPIKDFSEKVTGRVADNSLGLLFIDGNHSFQAVKKDFDLWSKKVRRGGVIAFHDSWHSARVQLYTALLLFSTSRLRQPKFIDCTTFIETADEISLADRFGNVAFVLFRLFVGWTGLVRLVRFGTRNPVREKPLLVEIFNINRLFSK